MSNEQDRNVRRFGRKNQKDRLPKSSGLFPIDDDEATDDDSPVVDSDAPSDTAFDIDQLNLPDTDSEALAMLSTLRDEVRAPVITPQAERYPPLAPTQSRAQSQPEVIVAEIPKTSPVRNFFYNTLSLIFLLATALTIVWFGFVWVDPQTSLNPFPPATPFVLATILPNENAVDFNGLPTPDADGQIFVVITDTPTAPDDATPSPFPFVVDPVLYIPNSNELGCNWWSIAGTVTDLTNNSIAGYRVRIQGENVDETVFSGASQAFGDGGFELPLIGTPQEAQFTVQLFTAQDAPLSNEITVTTRADCESNVAVINFVQNR